MNARKISVALVLAGAACLAAAVVTPSARAEGPAKCPKPTAAQSAAFDALKQLAGTWEPTGPAAEGQPPGTITFRVSSGGSVVLETMFPGSEKEMTNAYTLDGKQLVVTHYCAMGNQPRMASHDLKDTHAIEFKFRDGGNLDPRKDGYMGALTVTFVDANHLREEWTYFEAGKAQNHMTFDLARKS